MKLTFLAGALLAPATFACAAPAMRVAPSVGATSSVSALPHYKVVPRVAPKVEGFSLTDVRLLPGPFRHAQQLDKEYLLSLDADRLLSGFLSNAGLTPKAPKYGGWEAQGIAGHTLGHYLTALVEMYQSTGDSALKARADYIVSQLALCQANSPDGMLAAFPEAHEMFADLKAGHGDALFRGWVPWYTEHKIFAGLRDAYLLTGNEQAKTVLIRFADWAADVTKNLDDAAWQQMLSQEHGGMNETLADVYALTGNPKYLELARKFSHKLILDPLSQDRDTLTGLHANTQIPKVIGFERINELTGDPPYGEAARFFWQTVTGTRSFAIGGNSDYEHFFDPQLTDEHLSSHTAENCNVYNMLKLTRDLYQNAPAQAKWMEYYERALFNQILSSQDPVKGGFNYLNSLKPGHFKVYSNPTTAFWCCVGTGMENHAKYGETIYFHDANALYVNLFIPSTVQWRAKGITLRQNTRFPDENTARFTANVAQPTAFALKLRQPQWTSGAKLMINGRAQKIVGAPGSYETIARTWRNGDTVVWQLPMTLHSEALYAAPRERALLYGPIVLAADMGRAGMDKISTYVDFEQEHGSYPTPPIPVVISNENWATSNAWTRKLQRVPGPNLAFEARGLAQLPDGTPATLQLIPFSRAQNRRYNVYFETYSPAQWQAERERVAAEQRTQRELDARTLDEFRPGEQQNEAEHAFNGRNSQAGDFNNRKWRHAGNGGFFEFDLKVAPAVTNQMMVTYWGKRRRRPRVRYSGGRPKNRLANVDRRKTRRVLRRDLSRFRRAHPRQIESDGALRAPTRPNRGRRLRRANAQTRTVTASAPASKPTTKLGFAAGLAF